MSEFTKKMTFTDLYDSKVSEFDSPLVKDKRKSTLLILRTFS